MRTLARRLWGAALNLWNSNHVDYDGVSPRASLGRHVSIMSRSRVDAQTRIGSYTYVGYNAFITRAEIGRYVSIGNNVSVGPGEHGTDSVATSTAFVDDPYGSLTAQPCRIGSDVWIGVDSIIRRGVTIGDGAIVGANSFVSKDVPPFAIVGGSPARLIRFRFPESVQDRILQSGWWELELAEARIAVEALEAAIGAPSKGTRGK